MPTLPLQSFARCAPNATLGSRRLPGLGSAWAARRERIGRGRDTSDHTVDAPKPGRGGVVAVPEFRDTIGQPEDREGPELWSGSCRIHYAARGTARGHVLCRDDPLSPRVRRPVRVGVAARSCLPGRTDRRWHRRAVRRPALLGRSGGRELEAAARGAPPVAGLAEGGSFRRCSRGQREAVDGFQLSAATPWLGQSFTADASGRLIDLVIPLLSGPPGLGGPILRSRAPSPAIDHIPRAVEIRGEDRHANPKARTAFQHFDPICGEPRAARLPVTAPPFLSSLGKLRGRPSLRAGERRVKGP